MVSDKNIFGADQIHAIGSVEVSILFPCFPNLDEKVPE